MAYDPNSSQEQERRNDYDWVLNNGDGGDWHIDALCTRIGLSDADANVIKSEFDRTMQGLFGGNVIENQPEQYTAPRSSVRNGDPIGLYGKVFSVTRRIYFSLENIPVANSLRLWSLVDRVVLRGNKNPVVQSYLTSLRQISTLRVA